MMTEQQQTILDAWEDIRLGALKQDVLKARNITEKEYDENIEAVLGLRRKLISQCRYYCGEKLCPFYEGLSPMLFFWFVEEMYVTMGGNIPDNGDYDAYVEKDYPGIPRGILLYMFHTWGKGVIGIKENIDDFYSLVEEYLDIPFDHIPKDKIPNIKKNIEE